MLISSDLHVAMPMLPSSSFSQSAKASSMAASLTSPGSSFPSTLALISAASFLTSSSSIAPDSSPFHLLSYLPQQSSQTDVIFSQISSGERTLTSGRTNSPYSSGSLLRVGGLRGNGLSLSVNLIPSPTQMLVCFPFQKRVKEPGQTRERTTATPWQTTLPASFRYSVESPIRRETHGLLVCLPPILILSSYTIDFNLGCRGSSASNYFLACSGSYSPGPAQFSGASSGGGICSVRQLRRILALRCTQVEAYAACTVVGTGSTLLSSSGANSSIYLSSSGLMTQVPFGTRIVE